MNISLDAIVFPDTATATVSKTVTDFFAGKSEAEIQKYISLCQQADAFKTETDKKKGDCSEYPTAAFLLVWNYILPCCFAKPVFSDEPCVTSYRGT